jgi:hypothetical protein
MFSSMVAHMLDDMMIIGGDYLICIDPVTDILNFGGNTTYGNESELTYGKEYYIEPYKPHEDGRQFVRLINDKDVSNDYLITRFVTKAKFRDIKIDKLLQ